MLLIGLDKMNRVMDCLHVRHSNREHGNASGKIAQLAECGTGCSVGCARHDRQHIDSISVKLAYKMALSTIANM